jgi:hypothetical protein
MFCCKCYRIKNLIAGKGIKNFSIKRNKYGFFIKKKKKPKSQITKSRKSNPVHPSESAEYQFNNRQLCYSDYAIRHCKKVTKQV